MSQASTTSKQDMEIYRRVIDDCEPKASVARDLGVSPRTIGRAIERHERVLNGEVKEEPKPKTASPKKEKSKTPEYQVVASSESISITRDDGESATINKTDERWNEVSAKVWASGLDNAILEECFEMMNVSVALEKMSFGEVQVDAQNDTVTYKNKVLPSRLHRRIVDAVYERDLESVGHLCAFIENLYQNPSNRAVNELYNFLEAKDIKIVEGGMVECWKKVRKDFTDCHTGKIDNSVGANPKVDRNEVDEDSNRTCSYGLHVCSKSYLDHFHGAKTIKVLVHPKDFVAVPRDYNDAKARVCEYTVIRDCTGEV